MCLFVSSDLICFSTRFKYSLYRVIGFLQLNFTKIFLPLLSSLSPSPFSSSPFSSSSFSFSSFLPSSYYSVSQVVFINMCLSVEFFWRGSCLIFRVFLSIPYSFMFYSGCFLLNFCQTEVNDHNRNWRIDLFFYLN